MDRLSRQRAPLPVALAWLLLHGCASAAVPAQGPEGALARLVREAAAVHLGTHSGADYRRAAESYGRLLARLTELDRAAMELDDRVDRDLLETHLRTRLVEIDTLRLHTRLPSTYLTLPATERFYLRPCSHSDDAVRESADELERLPAVLDGGRENLERPARVWTEVAMRSATHTRVLLREHASAACVDDPALEARFLAAVSTALEAVAAFDRFLARDLLPRSTGTTWTAEEIELYRRARVGPTANGVEEMLRLAEHEEHRLRLQMAELAREIHPSGDLGAAWELMRAAAPPWQGVLPTAERYVELLGTWLDGPGSRVLRPPKHPGVTPRGRPLSPGFPTAAATAAPAARLAGDHLSIPPAEMVSAAEREAWRQALNPYWTLLLVAHEWLGHGTRETTRPMRRLFGSAHPSEAWAFYVEGLLEREGYFGTLPRMEELKTRMARRQRRMWHLQRAAVRLRMALGSMDMDEAARHLAETVGVDRVLAELVLRHDSQSPGTGLDELFGERVILETRDELERRQGAAFRLAEFHEAQGRAERALLWLRKCLEVFQGVVDNIGDPDLEATYLDEPVRARILGRLELLLVG